MASIQKAHRANCLWCLHVYSSTGRTTHIPLVLRPDWNKEHIAGGRPPEQKKRENAKKKHDAILPDLLGRTVCVCVCVRYSAALHRLAKKRPTATGMFLSRPNTHTLAEQWHLLCGCRKIFYLFFCTVWGTWNYSLNRIQSGFQTQYSSLWPVRLRTYYLGNSRISSCTDEDFHRLNLRWLAEADKRPQQGAQRTPWCNLTALLLTWKERNHFTVLKSVRPSVSLDHFPPCPASTSTAHTPMLLCNQQFPSTPSLSSVRNQSHNTSRPPLLKCTFHHGEYHVWIFQPLASEDKLPACWVCVWWGEVAVEVVVVEGGWPPESDSY